jgi:Domain of unknown function (DUF4424)
MRANKSASHFEKVLLMVTNRYPHVLFVLALMIWFCVPTWADIAPDPLHGGVSLGHLGGKSDKIAMAEEEVNIKVDEKGCQVHVIFKMKNLTDEEVNMQIGFPASYPEDLVDFTVQADGKKIEKIEKEEVYPDRPDGGRGKPRIWRVWHQDFAASAITLIEVKYSNQHKLQDKLTLDNYRINWTPEEKKELESRMDIFRFEYILRSGAGWAGPIGKCAIKIDFKGFTSEYLRHSRFYDPSDKFPIPLDDQRAKETAAKITANQIVWDVTNLKPTKDIRLMVAPKMTQTEEMLWIQKMYLRDPREPNSFRISNDFLRGSGKTKLSDENTLEFLKSWQTKIALWGPEAREPEVVKASQEVLSIMSIASDIGDSNRHRKHSDPAKLAEIMRPMLLRLQDQAKQVPPDTQSARYYSERIKEMLAWCDEQKKK